MTASKYKLAIPYNGYSIETSVEKPKVVKGTISKINRIEIIHKGSFKFSLKRVDNPNSPDAAVVKIAPNNRMDMINTAAYGKFFIITNNGIS